MNYDTIAERYAEALLDLATESSSVAAVTEEMRRMAEAYQASPDLQSASSNPLIPEAERLAAVDEVAARLNLSRIARNTVALLVQRRRAAALPAVARQLDRLANERAGIVRALVSSAEPLSDAYCVRLQRELEEMTGKKVLLDRQLDPSLLSGLVVKVGDRLIDGSARARLSELRADLLCA